ncbi:MAG: biotin/lipoyl-binding protein [Solobacterium sp.]|nr:biotin/lipoyl-binding protein [Solobacterium sp.]
MNKLKSWISRHKFLAVAAAAAIILTAVSLLKRPDPLAAYSEITLEPHDLLTYNSFNGTVEANTDYRVLSQVSSKVTSVNVKEGDYVEKGQVIAVLDDTAAQYQVALKKAMMNQSGTSSAYSIKDAETAYQNYRTALESGLNASMISAGRSLDSANLAVNHAKDALKSGLSPAEEAVCQAEARLNTAKTARDLAAMALPDETAVIQAAQDYQTAVAMRDTAVDVLDEAISDQELARLAYEAEEEGSAAKEEKRIIWAEKVEREAAARRNYEEAETEFEQAEAIYMQVNEAVSAYQAAVREVDAAQKALDTAESTRTETEHRLQQAVENSEHELEAARISYDSTALAVQQQLQEYETAIAKIRANANDQSGRLELENLEKALENYVITAPSSGTITALSVHEGEVAASGAQIALISGLDVLSVKVRIDEYSVVNAQEGKPVDIYVDAIGNTYQGTIRSVSDTAEVVQGISYYNAVIDFVSDDVVRTGMSTEVRLKNLDRTGAMCLPAEAVHFRADNSSYVNVKTGSTLKETDVKTGDSDGYYTEITEGLSDQDIVLYIASARKPGSENVVTLE